MKCSYCFIATYIETSYICHANNEYRIEITIHARYISSFKGSQHRFPQHLHWWLCEAQMLLEATKFIWSKNPHSLI